MMLSKAEHRIAGYRFETLKTSVSDVAGAGLKDGREGTGVCRGGKANASTRVRSVLLSFPFHFTTGLNEQFTERHSSALVATIFLRQYKAKACDTGRESK